MGFIRALENAESSMQRLGFLKYLTWRCSLRNTSSLEILGKDLVNNGIKLQHVYLSSEILPSRTGKLIYRDWRGYPYLISSLNLGRKGTYSLLVRGKVFLELFSQSELKAFSEPIPEVNPLILTDEQKSFLLYCFIENDGDILKNLYAQILRQNRVFTDREAGDLLPDIYRTLVKFYRSKIRSGVDVKRLDRLARSADNIEIRKGKAYTGRTHAIIPRLEPFVDLGLLKKQNPYKYEYYFSEQGKEFFTLFCSSEDEDVDKFLNESFFTALNKSFKRKRNSAQKDKIIKIIISVFNRIKSPLGYAPIKEIALFGAIKSLVDDKRYFEINQATKLIKEYQKSHPYAARFQVDRSGAPVYVKFINKNRNRRHE